MGNAARPVDADQSRDLSAIARKVTREVLAPEYQFPAVPAVASEVMALANAPQVAFKEVDKVVRRDPILAARVLAVANSSVYSPTSPIASLRTAMMMLGWYTLRDVLWQVVAEANVFRGGSRRRLQSMRLHAVAVAHMTRRLCQELNIDTENAFVCGLLHDLGRPLTWQILKEFELTVEQTEQLVDQLHTTIGQRVCDAWSLPPSVAQVARHHHDFQMGVIEDTSHLEGEERLPIAVAAAEALAYHYGMGDRQEAVDPNDCPVLDAAGLTHGQIEALLEWASHLHEQIR